MLKLSTIAGWASSLFSEHRAAAVYWATIKPEFRPSPFTRNAGRPRLRLGFIRRFIWRSERPPTSLIAIPRRSRAIATGWP
jgi:hypothetical protein